jgi:hypothetical protein
VSVLNALWAALVSICERQTVTLLGGIFQQAIEIVVEPVTMIESFRVAALDFVTLMIVHDSMLREFLVSQNFCATIARLFLQFRGQTLVQLALLRFCKAAMETVELQETVCREVVEPLLASEGDLFVTVSACEIVEMALGIGGNDKRLMERVRGLPSWEGFVGKVHRERKEMIKKGYGGKVPAVPATWVIPFLDM